MKVAFGASSFVPIQVVSPALSTPRWTCRSSDNDVQVSRRHIVRTLSLGVTSLGLDLGCIFPPGLVHSSDAETETIGDSGGAHASQDGELLEYRTTSSGLVIQDLRLGNGMIPNTGCEVRVRWTGRLRARYGWPYQPEAVEATYKWDTSELIPGFREGLSTMRAGGKRRLIVPDDLGYRTGQELPQPISFGDRRRLVSTVANPRRTGGGAGAVVIDVELLRVRTRGSARSN